MDRVGGYLAFMALEADARAYEDVLIVMAGEVDARRIAELRQKAGVS